MPSRAKSKRPAKKRAASSGPTSTSSPRLRSLHAALDGEIRARFPGAEARRDYGMRGWRIPRPVRIESWTGTIDPNYVWIHLAERKQGITLHFWNPYDPGLLAKRARPLAEAGFKVMVGCLQFNRKGEFPLAAVTPLLDEARRAMDAESR